MLTNKNKRENNKGDPMINDAGLKIIMDSEGLSLKPYKCPTGHLTIGYGHVIRLNEDFDRIDQPQAMELLKKDVQDAEKTVNTLIKVPLNENQYAALVSLAFNITYDSFKNSTFRKRLNSGDYDIGKELLKFDKGRVNGKLVPFGGLARRRRTEKLLYETEVR